MDSDLFNVAIIVLVVLAQLAGTIFAAWKKRQAAREAELRRGGLVVVQDDSGSNQTPARASRSSWDSVVDDEEDDPFEEQGEPSGSEDGSEEAWGEHESGQLDQAPGSAAPQYQRQSETQSASASTVVRTTQAESQVSPQSLPPRDGKANASSRARNLLGGNKLRQVVLAQTILNPSPLARRLRR